MCICVWVWYCAREQVWFKHIISFILPKLAQGDFKALWMHCIWGAEKRNILSQPDNTHLSTEGNWQRSSNKDHAGSAWVTDAKNIGAGAGEHRRTKIFTEIHKYQAIWGLVKWWNIFIFPSFANYGRSSVDFFIVNNRDFTVETMFNYDFIYLLLDTITYKHNRHCEINYTV